MRIGIDPTKQVTHPARNILLQALDNPSELVTNIRTKLFGFWKSSIVEDVPNASAGADYTQGYDSLKAPVLLKIKKVDVSRYGASGDPAENQTIAVNAAKTALRNAGGGALEFPRGTYLIDSFHWDWLAGGQSKLFMVGDGSATILKKRVNDGQTFVTIGRNADTLTYQGSAYIEDLIIEAIQGASGAALSSWSLTTFNYKNVKARYGSRAFLFSDCVTGLLQNCVGSGANRGYTSQKFTFPDTTFSDNNLITAIASAFKDNTEWGVFQGGGNQLNLIGCQVENNGVTVTPGGGLYTALTAGTVGTNRKFRAVSSYGTWYENNKGTGVVVLDGGASLFEGGGFVANEATIPDIYANGGKYTLVDVSMVNAKSGGAFNILDTASAADGNLIIGGEIVDLGGINRAKTATFRVNTGNVATPVVDNTDELRIVTAANILSIAHAVNTVGKRAGRMVMDSTNNRIMIALGSSANSNWAVADGSAIVTPV